MIKVLKLEMGYMGRVLYGLHIHLAPYYHIATVSRLLSIPRQLQELIVPYRNNNIV